MRFTFEMDFDLRVVWESILKIEADLLKPGHEAVVGGWVVRGGTLEAARPHFCFNRSVLLGWHSAESNAIYCVMSVLAPQAHQVQALSD
jgi:hypothetical protein